MKGTLSYILMLLVALVAAVALHEYAGHAIPARLAGCNTQVVFWPSDVPSAAAVTYMSCPGGLSAWAKWWIDIGAIVVFLFLVPLVILLLVLVKRGTWVYTLLLLLVVMHGLYWGMLVSGQVDTLQVLP